MAKRRFRYRLMVTLVRAGLAVALPVVLVLVVRSQQPDARTPLSYEREIADSRRCDGVAADRTCRYEVHQTFIEGRPIDFKLTIAGVGSASPNVQVERAGDSVNARLSVGSPCVEILSNQVSTAGISLQTGEVFADNALCRSQAAR